MISQHRQCVVNVRKVAALIVGLSVVVAACGSDDDPSTTESQATAVPTAEAASTTEAEPTTEEAPTTEAEGGASTAAATEPMSQEDAAAIDAAAMAGIEESGGELPGMWVGVWDPARGVHIGAYDEAVAGTAEATSADHGRIGSITKTFTATAILRQVADGALSLDDTIAEVVPDLAAELPDIAEITVEQLLSMTSGIPEFEYVVIDQILAAPTAAIDPNEIIVTTVEGQGVALAGTPGYSTTNYLILGEILEVLTGEPVEDVVTNLAQTAGLANTAFAPADLPELPEPASAGYVNALAAAQMQSEGVDIEPLGDVSDYNPAWAGAGGAMYSTVEDVGQWAATGFGNSLLPADLATRRLETETLPEAVYGLGIINYGSGWYGHTGEILGWNAIAAYQPETGAVFTAIVNESGSLLATLAPALAAFPDLAGAYGLG